MSSQLANLETFIMAEASADGVIVLKPTPNPVPEGLKPNVLATAIGNFKYKSDNRDHKLIDYFLIGLVTLFVHNTVVDHFHDLSLRKEIVEAVNPPPKVQITFSSPPKPKPVAPPPPIVQPKPPVPKVVPLKPQKSKPVPKVVEQAPIPTLSPSPVVDAAPAPPPALPPPVIQEKVTAPTAGADYLHNPPPEYPDLAQEMAWEGKVLLKVHVQADGKPSSVSVSKTSGHKELDDAAVKAVNKWTFVPAKRGDTPIDGWVTVPISFNL